jgi:hypothetical protein
MTPQELVNKELPKLSELEIAICIDTCKKAGAANAATALSKYISRLQYEIKKLEEAYNNVCYP